MKKQFNGHQFISYDDILHARDHILIAQDEVCYMEVSVCSLTAEFSVLKLSMLVK